MRFAAAWSSTCSKPLTPPLRHSAAAGSEALEEFMRQQKMSLAKPEQGQAAD